MPAPPDGLRNSRAISLDNASAACLLPSLGSILKPNEEFKHVCDVGYEYDVQKRIPDTTKAKEILGFNAQISLEQSVNEVINYMRNKG
jgi:nucleoside-diphosphate-sugar epimerase